MLCGIQLHSIYSSNSQSITSYWASQVVLVVKRSPAHAGDMRQEFDPWVRKIPQRSAWQPTPIFLPRESLVRGAQQAIVLKVTQNQTQLKQLSTIFYETLLQLGASLVSQLVKNPPAMQETWVRSLVWEDPLKKGKATHSSILAWRILWTIQSMGLQRAGND